MWKHDCAAMPQPRTASHNTADTPSCAIQFHPIKKTKTKEQKKTQSDKPVGGPEPTTLAHPQQFGDDEQRLGKQTMHSAQSMSGSQVAM
jgi:hypothetical protein